MRRLDDAGALRPFVAALLAVAVLVNGCSTPPEAASRTTSAETGLSAAGILDLMSGAYAICQTYRDSGRSTSRMPSGDGTYIFHKPFQTVFARPDRFRFASTSALPGTAWIVWSQGPVVRSWDWRDGHQRPLSLSSALIEIAGVSGGASLTVPKLLMPEVVGGSSVARLVDAERLGDEALGSSRCFRVRGRLDSQWLTLWIDQESHLLLRQVREAEVGGQRFEEITTWEPELDEEIPADALEFGAP